MQVADRAAVCILVDKWDKVPPETLQEEVQKVLPNHSHSQVNQLLDTLDVCKNFVQICQPTNDMN